MNRSRWLMGLALVLALGVQWASPVHGAPADTFNLEQMVTMADRIFIGTVSEERTGRDPRGLPATFTTFTISRALKGSPGDRIRIKRVGSSPAPSSGSPEWVPGVPHYQPEKEYLVFLAPDNALGFSSPVGALQGAFEIRSAEGGGRSVVNGVDNANLLIGLAGGDLTRLGLQAADQSFLSRGRGPIRLQVLVEAIARIGDGGEPSRSRDTERSAARVEGGPETGEAPASARPEPGS